MVCWRKKDEEIRERKKLELVLEMRREQSKTVRMCVCSYVGVGRMVVINL